MNNKSMLNRIGVKFNDEINSIKKARLDNGIDKKKISTARITNLFITHRDWATIKEDTINLNLRILKNEK
ncbi:MAG TPA: hypothetical protein ENK59_09290 [Thioploca sp.]|nr:hypothetical protein [Thioploca sp.]